MWRSRSSGSSPDSGDGQPTEAVCRSGEGSGHGRGGQAVTWLTRVTGSAASHASICCRRRRLQGVVRERALAPRRARSGPAPRRRSRTRLARPGTRSSPRNRTCAGSSELSVTTTPAARRRGKGCSCIDPYTPVATFEEGQTSRGIRWSAKPADQLRILDRSNTVADPVGPQVLERLTNAGRPRPLARVRRGAKSGLARAPEEVRVRRDREPFRTGAVERHHAASDVTDRHVQRTFGELHRRSRGSRPAPSDRRRRGPARRRPGRPAPPRSGRSNRPDARRAARGRTRPRRSGRPAPRGPRRARTPTRRKSSSSFNRLQTAPY